MYKIITEAIKNIEYRNTEQIWEKILQNFDFAFCYCCILNQNYICYTNICIEKIKKILNDMNNIDIDNIKFKTISGKEKKIQDKDINIMSDSVNNTMLITDITAQHNKKKIFKMLNLMYIFLSKVDTIKQIAILDGLTGAYNKKAFEQILKAEIERKKIFTLVLIDMDNFKHINDSLGHDVGDKYLKKFANVTKSIMRRSDILARIGGDEFALILRECETNDAKKVVMKLQKRIQEQNLDMTFSAGIAQYPIHGSNIKELFKQADQALYVAKYEKNKIVIANDTILKNLKIIEIKQGKVIPYYQKIVNFNTHTKIFGYEILLRIKKGNKIMSAQEWIKCAEDTKYILHLGQKNIEKLNYVLKRKKIDKNIILFINLSKPEIENKHYVKKIIRYIDNFEHKNICFEITERDALNENCYSNINDIIEHGYKIAIDDFGNGYAGLVYLQKIKKIDFLKIDKCFIKSNKRNVIILQTIQNLCEKMGINIIAEGIQDRHTADSLKEMGITRMQGYYFHRPEEL